MQTEALATRYRRQLAHYESLAAPSWGQVLRTDQLRRRLNWVERQGGFRVPALS